MLETVHYRDAKAFSADHDRRIATGWTLVSTVDNKNRISAKRVLLTGAVGLAWKKKGGIDATWSWVAPAAATVAA